MKIKEFRPNIEQIEWINVKDALPPFGVEVLQLDVQSGRIGNGRIYSYTLVTDGDVWVPIWESTNGVFKPTHWTHLFY